MSTILSVLKVKDSDGNWHGIPGLKGDTGEPFKVLGNFATREDLEETITDPNIGDAYLVGSTGTYHVFIAQSDGWLDAGLFMPKGEQGEPATSEQIAASVGAWLDNHVDPQTGYVVDDSLSIVGAAADAAAVGALSSAFIRNSFSSRCLSIYDAAKDAPFRSLKLEYDYVEGGIAKAEVNITGKNLLNGEEMATKLKDAVPSAVLDTENKTIQWASSSARGIVLFQAKFKENTPYTLILYGRNLTSTSVYSNINLAYTDGTATGNNIRFATAGEDSYAVFTSNSNKTIARISTLFVSGSTILHYDKCGLFEGTVTVDDFEAYLGKTIEADLSSQISSTIYGGSVDFVTGKVISTKQSDGTDLIPTVEYQITPQRVTSLYGLNNFISKADSEYVEYYVDTKMYVDELSYDPDYFDGTDSEKLQQCFDALANIGGNIFIKRTYVLSEDLIINNDSDQQRFIRVFGMGKNAKIDCGPYRITGPKVRHVYGGVFWNGIAFDGTSIGFDVGILIRLWFFHCAFKGFSKAFSADESETLSGETRRYIQTLYLSQCEIKGCNTGIYIRGGTYNMGLHQCLIENVTYGINNYSGSLMGVRIYDCVIEAVWDTGIRVNGNGASLTIDNNYFEAIPQSIYLSDSTAHRAISIRNNYFVQNNKSCIFIKPASTMTADRIKGVIDGNTHLNSDGSQALVKFTSVPAVPQPWRIEDNYPNRVDNAERFAVGSTETLASEAVLDPESEDYKDLLDGVYTVSGEKEIIQVISSGNSRLQMKFKDDAVTGPTFSFRIQDITDGSWSEWE